MNNTEWSLCPTCGGKTRDRIRQDTILINYPLYCPKCKQGHLMHLKIIE
ncbi:cysteine-rich KTR domain-containing protein [Ruminococcus sp. AM31-15AC]|nr:conjugal transfer protein [Ruminococcus sp. AM31-15AC]